MQGSNSIAVAYDDGTVMVKVGREEPVASMDSSGKIIWARHNEVQTVNIKVRLARGEGMCLCACTWRRVYVCLWQRQWQCFYECTSVNAWKLDTHAACDKLIHHCNVATQVDKYVSSSQC